MTITHIHVTAATGFNHPHESYANFKPSVSLTATIEPDEDPLAKAVLLQQTAQNLVMQQKQSILDQIEDDRKRRLRKHGYEEAANDVPQIVLILQREDLEEWRRGNAEASLRDHLRNWQAAHEDEPDRYPAPPTLEQLGVQLSPTEDGEATA